MVSDLGQGLDRIREEGDVQYYTRGGRHVAEEDRRARGWLRGRVVKGGEGGVPGHSTILLEQLMRQGGQLNRLL